MNTSNSNKQTDSCVLCDRPRARVAYLIASASGAVCSDCVTAARAIIETHSLSRPTLLRWVSAWRRLTFVAPTGTPLARLRIQLESELEQLSGDCAFAVSTPLVRAACELWDFDADACRRIAEHARRLRNSQARLDALSHIAETDRTSGDRIAISVAAGDVGEYERGLRALDSVSWTDPIDEMFSHTNRAALTMETWRRSDTVQRNSDGLQGVTKELDIARQLLADALQSADPRKVICEEMINANTALYEFLSGNLSSAKSILVTALHRVPDLHPSILLGLGDVHAALGEKDEAARMWRAALDSSHPESRVASEAHMRLESLESVSNDFTSMTADSGNQ